MNFIRYIFLLLIFAGSTSVGYILSKRFKNRTIELKDLKSALNIMKNKIKFTYKPLEEIFEEISVLTKGGIADLFSKAHKNIKTINAKDAWNQAVEDTKDLLNFNKEDLNLVKSIGNMLGKTDVEGQVSELNLSIGFIDTQIEKAEAECKRSEKMYKSLGTIIGLAIVIILF